MIDTAALIATLRESLRRQLAVKLGISPSDAQLDDIVRNVAQAVISLDTADETEAA